MESNIKPGACFPDFELPDHTDVKRKLSFLQGNDPMILMLGRGIYCPKDRQQLLSSSGSLVNVMSALRDLLRLTVIIIFTSMICVSGSVHTGHSYMMRSVSFKRHWEFRNTQIQRIIP